MYWSAERLLGRRSQEYNVPMSVLELSDEQVISIVRQLPAARKRTALLALAQDSQARREERMRFGEAQLRRACAERGLDWDHLSEDERETFVDELLEEGMMARRSALAKRPRRAAGISLALRLDVKSYGLTRRTSHVMTRRMSILTRLSGTNRSVSIII